MIEFLAQELGTYAIVHSQTPVNKWSRLYQKRREPYKPNSENIVKEAGDTLMSVPNKQDQASQDNFKNECWTVPYLLFL